MQSVDEQATTGTVKHAPIDALIRLGLKRSVSGSQMITASAFAASAERRTAPRLPGFSTLSKITSKGACPFLLLICFPMSASVYSRALTIAVTPSVPPRYAIRS